MNKKIALDGRKGVLLCSGTSLPLRCRTLTLACLAFRTSCTLSFLHSAHITSSAPRTALALSRVAYGTATAVATWLVRVNGLHRVGMVKLAAAACMRSEEEP